VARHVAEEPAIGERVKRACRTAPIIRPETPTRPGSWATACGGCRPRSADRYLSV